MGDRKRGGKEGVLIVNVILKGEAKQRFEKLKQHYNFESNTDLVRLLITQAYDELVEGAR